MSGEGSTQGRLATRGKERPTPTRCTFMVIGGPCNRFPAWAVPGTKGQELRCEHHRGK